MLSTINFGGHGQDLLLLHGTGGGSGDWTPVAEHLIDDFSVVAVDLPGHGSSPKPYRWAFSTVIDELARLELDRPVVAGMSLGGMLAVHWGSRHPDCPAVVSFDGHRAPVTALANDRGLTEERARLLRGQLKSSFDAMLSMFPTQRAMFEEIEEAMAADDVVRALPAVPVPTTMVVSTFDLPGTEIYRELMTGFRAGLDADLQRAASSNHRVRVLSLPTTHAMHLEAPERMADIIRAASDPSQYSATSTS